MISQYDDIHPSYWIFQLYGSNFQGTVINAESDKPEILNVYGCVQDNGSIVIMVVNKETKKDWTAQVIIENRKIPIFTRKFPGMSLTCLKIPMDGTIAEVHTYGLEQILSNK